MLCLQKARKDASSSAADGADGGKGGKKGGSQKGQQKGHGSEADGGAGPAGAKGGTNVAKPAEGGEGSDVAAAATGATEGGEAPVEVIAGRKRKGKGKDEKPANWFELKVGSWWAQMGHAVQGWGCTPERERMTHARINRHSLDAFAL